MSVSPVGTPVLNATSPFDLDKTEESKATTKTAEGTQPTETTNPETTSPKSADKKETCQSGEETKRLGGPAEPPLDVLLDLTLGLAPFALPEADPNATSVAKGNAENPKTATKPGVVLSALKV